ncbi:MAG TPA: glycosyltransferase family A protein, partial [Pseudolabrys sp.]|nr:glycosyltransferase family A protein [Pseudolabrys sp.]
MDYYLLVLSVLWCALVAWLIWRAIRQQGGIRQLAPCPIDAALAPDIAIIIPARDERENIGPCLKSLLAQEYPRNRLRVVVVDDESSDGTAEIVAEMARLDSRITLLSTPPLPPGWKGKVNGCCTGARAVPAKIQWLCFLDADMRAQPQAIAGAVQCALAEKLDLLSLAPRHELGSFAERLMLPCGHYLLAVTQDIRRIQTPESKEVIATGQFMLLRRAAYDDIGGHAAVCSDICEDLQLARLMKWSGHRVMLHDGSKLLSTRMYTGWRTLWPGFAKNLVDMVGGPLRTVLMAFAAVAVSWAAVLLPAFDLYAAANGSTLAAVATIPAALGALAAFALHIAGSRHFGIPFWYGLIFPVGYTAGAVMALDSLRWRLT